MNDISQVNPHKQYLFNKTTQSAFLNISLSYTKRQNTNEKVLYLANTRTTNAQSMAVAVAWAIARTSIAHFHNKEAHVDNAVN